MTLGGRFVNSEDKKHLALGLILAVALTYFGTNFTDSYFKSKKDINNKDIQLEKIKALKEVNPNY